MADAGAPAGALHGDHDRDKLARFDEDAIRRRVRELVRERPLVAVAAAAAVGAVLGGVIFSRLGRLVVIAAVGYAASDLWKSEGRLDIDEIVGRLLAGRT